MKKEKKNGKKLTPKDYKRMWGEDGPYSQVRICEEARILDDRVSRVFLVIEAEINPFTFEYVKKNRDKFVRDEPVMQLLDHAQYRDQYGYVVSAGEVGLQDEGARQFARTRADMTIQTLIRMHAFVMDECGLRQDSEYGVVEDQVPRDEHFVWNAEAARVEPADDEMWESTTKIKSPMGVRNNKARFFFVLAFVQNPDLKKASAIALADTLTAVSARLNVDIEDAETFHRHATLTALLPFELAPATFIESLVDECNAALPRPLFQKDHLVTNVKKPGQEQIMSFLAQLP